MRTVEITVGLFLIAGILSLLMLSLQVSGLSHFLREEPGYKIKADFANIGGLKIRGRVTLAGVVIGRVSHIELEPQSFNATVTLTINPKVTYLPLDTRASIQTAGLLGDNYISLTPGFDQHAFLKEGDVIPAENTDSAIVLENLVSQFLAGQASKEPPSSGAAAPPSPVKREKGN